MTKSLTSNSGSFNGRPAEFQPRRNKGLGGGRLSMPAVSITICKFVAHCRHASDVVYDVVYTVIDWSWETKIDSSSMGPRTATAAAKPVPISSRRSVHCLASAASRRVATSAVGLAMSTSTSKQSSGRNRPIPCPFRNAPCTSRPGCPAVAAVSRGMVSQPRRPGNRGAPYLHRSVHVDPGRRHERAPYAGQGWMRVLLRQQRASVLSTFGV